MSDYRPRVTIDVSEDLFRRVQYTIPRSMRRPLFELFLEDIVKVLADRDSPTREKILALIIDRQVDLLKSLPSFRETV